MAAGPGLSRRTLLLGGVVAVLAAACGRKKTSADPSPGLDGGATTSTAGPTTSTTTTAVRPSPPVLSPGQPATFVPRGPATAKRVALTFHTNGDLTQAQQLLDALGRRQVPITAFVVGNWLDAHPDWAVRLKDAGHELANHTFTHPTFTALSRAAMLDEIGRCRDTLKRLTGTGGTFFRPSGTDDGVQVPPAVVQQVAAEAGYPVVLGFDVDPLDYDDPGAAAVAERTLAKVAPGGIVSLHFGHPGTIAALPTILDGLAARGLTPVTASTLLGYS
jgi:peptidoglycan/xylan/chitin deacetylase (PgdA/CDA1 family)